MWRALCCALAALLAPLLAGRVFQTSAFVPAPRSDARWLWQRARRLRRRRVDCAADGGIGTAQGSAVCTNTGDVATGLWAEVTSLLLRAQEVRQEALLLEQERNAAQLSVAKEVFSAFQQGCSRPALSCEQLRAGLAAHLGLAGVSEEHAGRLLRRHDLDGDGELSFEEFAPAYQRFEDTLERIEREEHELKMAQRRERLRADRARSAKWLEREGRQRELGTLTLFFSLGVGIGILLSGS